MTEVSEFDVVIVGAGPAGTSCALALRDANLKVALIDKDRFPRNKTCGDAIPGPSLKVLKSILPEGKLSFDAFTAKQAITSSLIYTSKGKKIEVSWKAEAYNSTRTDFDNFLLELVKTHTDTSIFEGVHIDTIECNEKVTIKGKNSDFEISCNVVIGADGANSIVSRAFSVASTGKSKSAVAVRAYYESVDCPEHVNEFYLLKTIPGYFWIFPLTEGKYNVGIGLLGNDTAEQKIDIKQAMQDVIEQHPIISKKFSGAKALSKVEGFGLPLGGEKRTISGPHFLLIGDAAWLIDPLQGHGIDKAMKSGVLAAEQVKTCVQQHNFSAIGMAAYDAAIEQSIGKELKKNLRLMRFFRHRQWLINLLAPLMGGRLQRWLQKRFYRK